MSAIVGQAGQHQREKEKAEESLERAKFRFLFLPFPTRLYMCEKRISNDLSVLAVLTLLPRTKGLKEGEDDVRVFFRDPHNVRGRDRLLCFVGEHTVSTLSPWHDVC
jgi:hypothetical protein